MLEDAARVGLLTGLGAGMYRIHPALPGYLAAGWHAEDPGGYDQEREACEQALCTACAAFSRWLTGQIESGDAALAYAIIGLQRRTLGAMLGHALDHHAWDDAERYCPGAGCVLGHPRPRRGSRRLGRPHPGRHRRPRPGTRADTRRLAVAVHHHPAGHPAAGRRAAGPGRADLPAGPRLPAGPARNRMDPQQHRRHLPPARHDRPGPRAAGRGRGLVPQIPHHQRRTRRPPRHGDHLPPARHHRPGPRAAGRGRRLVPQIPHHQRRTRRPPRHGDHLPPARHAPPRTAGGWTRPRTGTANPSPSTKNSATAPAWRAPTTSSA